MKGTIELFTGRVPKHKKILSWYSKEECRGIYNLWMNQYEDAVIHIWPEPVDNHVDKRTEFILKGSKEIEMDDFIMVGTLKRETFYHRCYGG